MRKTVIVRLADMVVATGSNRLDIFLTVSVSVSVVAARLLGSVHIQVPARQRRRALSPMLHVILLVSSLWVSLLAASTDDPDYLDAVNAQASGDYVSALDHYANYLQNNRGSALETKVSARAAILADALKRGVDGALPQYLDALDRRDERDLPEAQAILEDLMQGYPDSYLQDDALYLRGYMALMDTHNFSSAHELLRRLQLEHPDSSYFDTALYGEAVALEQLGNTDGARGRFTLLRERHTQFSLSMIGSFWPKSTYLSRYWFDRANNRLKMLEERQDMAARLVARSSSNEPGYELRIEVNVDGIQLPLLLKPSPVASTTSYVDKDLANLDFNSTRLYAGKVENDPDSWVRVSLRGNAIEGVVSSYGQRYELEPDTMVGTIDYYQSKSADKIDMRREGLEVPGLHDYVLHPPLNPEIHLRSSTPEPQLGAATPGDVTRLVRMNIVVDSQYDDYYGGSGLVEAMSSLNVADGIYREHFGMAIKVENATVFTERNADPMNMGAVTLENTLRSFRDYHLASELASADIGLTYLFSGNQNTDEAIGLAWIGAVCRNDGFDVGVITPTSYGDMLITHELGHSLGAQHDTDTTCNSRQNLLMWPRISSTTEQAFSSCSTASVSTGIDKSCLQNTLDLSLQLETDSTSGFTATVTNNDLFRTASQSRLSVDVTALDLNQVPASCSESAAAELICDVAPLQPGESRGVAFQLAEANAASMALLAKIEPVGFYDVEDDNNLAQLNVLPGSGSNPVWADASDDSDNQLASNNSGGFEQPASGSGGGGALFWLLAGLGMGCLKRTHKRRLHPRRMSERCLTVA